MEVLCTLLMIVNVYGKSHKGEKLKGWQDEEGRVASYYYEKYGPPPWMYKTHRTLLEKFYHYGGRGFGIIAIILICIFIYTTVTYMKSYFKENIDLSKFQLNDKGVSVNVNVRNRPMDEYVNDTKKLIEKSAKKFARPGVFKTVTDENPNEYPDPDSDNDSILLNADDSDLDEPTRKKRHRIRRAFSRSSRHSDT